MADTVTVKTLFNGQRRKIIHLTCNSDGTGESAVSKFTLSNFTFAGGQVPTYSVVDMIDYNNQGFTSVKLEWAHTANDLIANLPGALSGTIHFEALGGKVDPKSSGGTGNIVLTTAGATSGATYDIVLYIRPKN